MPYFTEQLKNTGNGENTMVFQDVAKIMIQTYSSYLVTTLTSLVYIHEDASQILSSRKQYISINHYANSF